MELLVSLGRTLGFSLTSGVNLYATVAVLGLAARFQWVTLPPQYQVFNNDWMIGGALAALCDRVRRRQDPVDRLALGHACTRSFVPSAAPLVAMATVGDASPGISDAHRHRRAAPLRPGAT